MLPLPSGTVTFLFSDIAGSTKIAQQFPDQWEELRARHNALLHQAMQAHSGHVFQIIGDAFCVAFHTVAEALEAAIDSQRLLQAEPWQPAPIKVRMGIHTGPAFPLDSQDTLGGYQGYTTMARVQRVMSIASGGQILLSNAGAGLALNHPPKECSLLDLQEVRLKGFSEPERLWQVVAPGLQKEFPPLQSAEGIPHNLPAQLTHFVGRQEELGDIAARIAAHRLVTLTGPGGIGKTRLAVQAAHNLLADFWHGIFLVELATISSPELVAGAVSTVLGIKEDQDRPVQSTLTDYLRDKSILLVLDNCEHVIEPCAQLVVSLLRHCPKLKILSTSRESLGVPGEAIVTIPPMSLPPAGQTGLDGMREADAVKLFIQRAGDALPGFELTQSNMGVVQQICRQLDGIPLALELAAARVRLLTVEQIAARLEHALRFLGSSGRSIEPRQKTLRATLDWSYNLLPEEERIIYRRLAVFSGSWTLEAAEDVCVGRGVDNWQGIDLLDQLVNKSLINVDHQAPGGTRYYLLEPARQYAWEKLVESGEAEDLRRLHLEYYLRLGSAARQKTRSADRLPYQMKMKTERENFRAALDWAFIEGDPKLSEKGLTLAIDYFYLSVIQNDEHLERIRKGLASIPDSPENPSYLWAKALVIAGSMITSTEGYKMMDAGLTQLRQHPPAEPLELAEYLVLTGVAAQLVAGDITRANALLAESTALYRANPGDALWDFADALYFQAWGYFWAGDYTHASRACSESSSLFLQLEDTVMAAWALRLLSFTATAQQDFDQAKNHLERALMYLFSVDPQFQDLIQDAIMSCYLPLANIELLEGRFDPAIQHVEEALVYYRQVGDLLGIQQALTDLARIQLAQGDIGRAAEHFRDCLVTTRMRQDVRSSSIILAYIADVCQAAGQLLPAVRLYGAVESYSAQWSQFRQVEHRASLEKAALALGSDDFALAFSEGKMMTLEMAIAYGMNLQP